MTHYIDVHHHILPSAYVDAVGAVKIGSQGSAGKIPAWSVAGALARMDAAGVATAITSVSAPGLDVADAALAVRLARVCNEQAAEMTVRHAGRFGMFATLPLVSTEAALAELAYCADQLQADGVCLLSNFQGRYLGDTSLWPVLEELNRREAVVFVHPTSPQVLVPIEGLSASSLDFTFDTARAMASLIFSGALLRFPQIRFIFSHMGGAMPYIAERIAVLARNNPRLQAFLPHGIRHELARCYFDTALSANPVTFAAMAAISGLDNVMFGTDYPFGPPDQIASAAASLQALALGPDACLTASQLRRIARGTAETLFPRFATPAAAGATTG